MVIPRIILFDLDETIHFSEEMKSKAWSDILKPFGYCWEENNVGNLRSVPKELRPKFGLSPHNYIAALIKNLGLSNLKLYKDKEEMIEFIKNQWSVSLIDEARRFAKEGRLKEVPGAVEAIVSAHKKGYKIGVVTQAPVEYAEIVLKSLGLLNNDSQENYIDVVVSGDMVENKKPHPESLILATELIIIQTVIDEKESNLKTKLTIKEKMEIGRSINQEYFGSDKKLYPNPVAVIGDTKFDIEAGRNYHGKSNIKTILIDSRNLSNDEIQRIKPDFTINHFKQLLSKIEGNIHRVEKHN